jgi:hypothetical protein
VAAVIFVSDFSKYFIDSLSLSKNLNCCLVVE